MNVPVVWAMTRAQVEKDRGQRVEDRGQKTEDRGQRTEDRGQRTEDRGQRTEAWWSIAAVRRRFEAPAAGPHSDSATDL